MKNLLLLFLLSGCALPIHAQINEEDNSYQAVTYWNSFDSVSYLLTKLNIQVYEDDHDTISKSVYRVAMVVEDSTEKSYTVVWQYRLLEMTTNGKSIDITPKLRKLTDLRLVIKTDEMGAFVSLENWEEVMDHSKKADEIMANYQYGNDTARKKVRAKVVEEMYDKNTVENALIEMKPYFSFYGGAYPLHETLTDTLIIQSLVGNVPISMDVSVRLDNMDFEEETATLVYHQTFDATQMKQLVVNLQSEDLPTDPQSSQTLDNILKSMDIDFTIVSIFHGPTGWILYSEYRRVAITDKQTRLEEIYFEME